MIYFNRVTRFYILHTHYSRQIFFLIIFNYFQILLFHYYRRMYVSYIKIYFVVLKLLY